MKKLFTQFGFAINKINRQHLQTVVALLALVLLVLGAGAPDDGGIGGGLR
jgi:hypothetical protein